MSKLFSVYDAVSESYFPPFVAVSRAEANRMIVEISSDPNTSLHKYPTDHHLFELGEFNPHTGVVTMRDPSPVSCGTILEINTRHSNPTLAVQLEELEHFKIPSKFDPQHSLTPSTANDV